MKPVIYDVFCRFSVPFKLVPGAHGLDERLIPHPLRCDCKINTQGHDKVYLSIGEPAQGVILKTMQIHVIKRRRKFAAETKSLPLKKKLAAERPSNRRVCR